MTYTPDTALIVERERNLLLWSEPPSVSERSIIERVLRDGDLEETRRWLSHCMKIFNAQRELTRHEVCR